MVVREHETDMVRSAIKFIILQLGTVICHPDTTFKTKRAYKMCTDLDMRFRLAILS